MARKEILERIQRYVHPFRVTKGKGFRLKDFDPADTCGLKLDKGEAAGLLQSGTAWLAEEQDILYAQDRWSLLLIFQAMDAAGKDGTIKHVMSGVNPQGCQVFSFKQPSAEDLAHDFMWRYSTGASQNGGGSESSTDLITRRSSSCACTRKSSKRQKLPAAAGEQADLGRTPFRHRPSRRLPHPARGRSSSNFSSTSRARSRRSASWSVSTGRRRHWKFSPSDVSERQFWDDYMHAFEEAIRATAAVHAPWYVVPADNKWFTRLVVAAAIVEVVEELDLAYPRVGAEKKKELAAARAELAAEA